MPVAQPIQSLSPTRPPHNKLCSKKCRADRADRVCPSSCAHRLTLFQTVRGSAATTCTKSVRRIASTYYGAGQRKRLLAVLLAVIVVANRPQIFEGDPETLPIGAHVVLDAVLLKERLVREGHTSEHIE